MVQIDLNIKQLGILYKAQEISKEEALKLLKSFDKEDLVDYLLDIMDIDTDTIEEDTVEEDSFSMDEETDEIDLGDLDND